jgi:hypothetical protein
MAMDCSGIEWNWSLEMYMFVVVGVGAGGKFLFGRFEGLNGKLVRVK